MKKFDNTADSNNEKSLRRGYTVPDGAVNLAWVQSPSLNPKNNVVIIDTSRAISENSPEDSRVTRLAFANVNGRLEDEEGNQIWAEEFPIIGDIFDESILAKETDEEDYKAAVAYPFRYVSRFFHLDSANLTNGRLKFIDLKDIKVIDNLGNEYVNDNGEKKYRIAIIDPTPAIDLGSSSVNGVYRVNVFLDIDPTYDELYLAYNKVQVNARGILNSQELDYKELINPYPYYDYVPAQSTVFDRSNESSKIYTSEPLDVKDKMIGSGNTSFAGWKYFVPRKAIPDPRIFQTFNWRVACEITKNVAGEDDDTGSVRKPIIKVGVLVVGDGSYLKTRANFLFYQLNKTDYNYSKVKFVNPLTDPSSTGSSREQQLSSYWTVNIKTVTLEQLSQFDVLVLAPVTSEFDISSFLPKLNYFVETVGGTLIIETSGRSKITNFTGATFTQGKNTIWAAADSDINVQANTLRPFDGTPYNLTDTFATYGPWKEWPPDVVDIINDYTDIGSILVSANNIAGWNLTNSEKNSLSPYVGLESYRSDDSLSRFQYIKKIPANYRTVLEAQVSGGTDYKAVMIHRKFRSGGNIFVSTCGMFEDHLFEVNGTMVSRSLQVADLRDLSPDDFRELKQTVSSIGVKGEMKFRLNTMMYSTLGKPIQTRKEGDLVNDGETFSATVYSDWSPSWVINPNGGVLSRKEIEKFNFSLLPTNSSNTNPKWQRTLSPSTIEQIIKKKIRTLPAAKRDSILSGFDGATKRYFILVSNPLVQTRTSPNLDGSSLPTAWTDASSPIFEPPYHLGQYVVRDEMITASASGKGKKLYPPKPYQLQVVADAVETATSQSGVTAHVEITGTYRATIVTPEYTTIETQTIPGTNPQVKDLALNWKDDGRNNTLSGYKHQGIEYDRPAGLNTFTDANYNSVTATNWPYMGVWGTLSVNRKSTGDLVKLVQKTINQLIFYNYISGPYLDEDGKYGTKTEGRVTAFQTARGAQYVDGVVDAETWSLLGYYLLALDIYPGITDPLIKKYANKAKFWMSINSLSDSDPDSVYLRQTWASGYNKASTEQTYTVKFSDRYRIYKVSIKPWLLGLNSNRLHVNWLDVGNDLRLGGYKETNGSPGAISGKYAGDNNWIHLPIPEKEGNSVIFTAEQKGLAGWGDTTKVIGIRDVIVHAKKYISGTSETTVDVEVTHPATTVEVTRDLTWKGRVQFEAGVPWILWPSSGLPEGMVSAGSENDPTDVTAIDSTTGGKVTVTKAQWDLDSLYISAHPVQPHNEDSEGGIQDFFRAEVVNVPGSRGTLNKLKLTYMGYDNSVSETNRKEGTIVGSGNRSFFTMDETKNIDKRTKFGWISKDDGLKLICDSDGLPYGFPSLPSSSQASVHFTRYRLNSIASDPTVYYGFYDIKEKEFISNSSGEPEISYYDYIRRNPINIYVAVKTTYELNGVVSASQMNENVKRPFKWAMPVYTVTTENKSKIQIESPSPYMDINEVWPIPVRTGFFSKEIDISPRSQGSLTGYLTDFQGKRVTAYYSIPEANNNIWSSLYGRPNVDVIGEIPVVLDERTIRVRQYPILMKRMPTSSPTDADPVKPIFKVWTRESLSEDWTEVSMADIEDYNVWNGTIYLRNTLPSLDPRLVRVDYTSKKNAYDLKHDGTNRINLNPYVNGKPEWLDVPLYVYILPTHIKESGVENVTESFNSNTLRVTTDTSIFNKGQPEYDPTALMLGIVYISSSFDIEDLVVLDTRKRGGGFSSFYDEKAALDIETEYSSYWDAETRQNLAYQKGGFVIIRLPAELSNDFTFKEIQSTIERNITVGVRYNIEDMDGNKWVDES